MDEPSAQRRIFDLRLEHVHLRAVRAVIIRRDGGLSEASGEVDHALHELESSLTELERATVDAPMTRLAVRFGLSRLECDFVWCAVAHAVDPRLLIHAVALIGSEAKRGMSLALYVAAAGVDASSGRELALALTSVHPLLRYQLLEVGDRLMTGTAVALRTSNRLASYLAGSDEIDPLLHEVGGRIGVPDPLAFDAAQEVALRRLGEGLAAADPVVVIVEGPIGSGRRTAAVTLAARNGQAVVGVDVKRLLATPGALEEALAALRRECLLGRSLPLVAEVDDLIDSNPESSGGRGRALARILDDFPGPVVLTTSRPGLDLGLQRRTLRITWPVPDTATRRALWRQALGAEGAALADAELTEISMRYRLGAGGIERATASARLIGAAREPGGGVVAADLIGGIRNNIAERLGSLARRVEVKQTWDDVVLSSDLMDQIHALTARIRHAHLVYEEWGFSKKQARGIGVPALFSGPPGTGKTMVAGIIARELGLELLQVDLSQVVSKWIGETEKQLSRVFDAAEAGHALLLFDEADALFAKRTEVKGATDRYANLEVNYLLQRVESFGGITILTTNFDTGIDPALKRRLAAHVVFWPPDEDERADLWQRMLATGSAPVAGPLDMAKLARAYPDMTGANIRNAVLAAAFLAASERKSISQDHLERAAKGEYRTMGRVLR